MTAETFFAVAVIIIITTALSFLTAWVIGGRDIGRDWE